MYGIIYKLTCLISWKVYVGQTTKTLDERFIQHSRTDSLIGKAIRKYGAENFLREVLEVCDTPEQLNERERYWIRELNSKVPNGYNLTDGGAIGWTHLPQTRANISAARKGKPLSQKHRAKIGAAVSGEKNGFFGKHHTPEALAKMAEIHRGETPYKNLLNELNARQMLYTEFAELMGLSIPAISEKMHGNRNFTTRDKIMFEKIFCKPAEYLLQRDDGKNSMSNRGSSPYENLLNEIYKHKLKYGEIAELLGMAQATFSCRMHGKLKFTERDKKKLAEIFGKPVEYLFERDDDGVYVKPSTPHRRESPYPNLIHELGERKLSYAALARLMGWDKNSFARKMSGDRSFMDKEKNKLAEFFGKPVEYLFKRND